MKETVTLNIGSEAFTLDKDASQLLRSYLNDIRSRLPEDEAETIDDIEVRIAEIFRDRITSPMRVITIEIVRATMKQLGAPSDFGERRSGVSDETSGIDTDTAGAPQPAPRKLYRSRSERSIAGVCGGLAAYFDADPTMIRLLMLLMILFGGLSIWAYFILWIVIPEEPQRKFTFNDKKR